MKHWLIKTEPGTYSWDDLVKDGRTRWDGVRNFQARNHIRAMRRGDLALVYHSGAEKRILGVATVVSDPYPDPTAREGDWAVVNVAPEFGFERPVTLAQIKAEPALKDMVLVKQSRLSVQPVAKPEFDRLVRIGRRSR